MLTLKFFNGVVERPTNQIEPFVSEEGYVILPGALWAKDHIIDFYRREQLDGNDLNKTFHKSWQKIKESTRVELLMEQIMHYFSTYGSNFQDEIYLPQEVLNVPDIKLKYRIIKSYTKDEMAEKCLGLLRSGIALAEDTLNGLLTILTDTLDYKFTGSEGIRNKEAVVKIAELYKIYPDNPVEFLRYIIYRSTGTALLIKNPSLILKIKESTYNPSPAFKEYGPERLAEIFNRFKPLFLAYKGKCPKTINKIAKLSKKYHKPLISNPLNEVTQRELTKEDIHWLDNATPFALFKALSACYTRSQGQDSFVYRIRNGKSWIKESKSSLDINDLNYRFILKYFKEKYSMEGTKIYLPKDVDYALPTSEKMFVGNIPTGTRFSGKKLAVGIYWEDAWGARDLDLSGLNIGGKIGWNSSYNQDGGRLMFSGDITSAPNGAVEYLYANKGLEEPTLVINNVFSGDQESGYKIIVGKGDNINKDYMMNPNKLFAEVKCNSVQGQTILGIFIPNGEGQNFVLLNFGAGNSHVSGYSENSTIATKALFQQWSMPLTFEAIIRELGAEVVPEAEGADYDFSLSNLEKDSFIKIFKK
jgi:hypothetical protein